MSTDLKGLSAHDEERQIVACAEHSSLTGSATLSRWFSPRRIEEHSTGQRDRFPCSRGQLRVEVQCRRLWNVLFYRTPLWQMCMVLVDRRRRRRDTDRPCASARKLTIAETSTGYE